MTIEEQVASAVGCKECNVTTDMVAIQAQIERIYTYLELVCEMNDQNPLVGKVLFDILCTLQSVALVAGQAKQTNATQTKQIQDLTNRVLALEGK